MATKPEKPKSPTPTGGSRVPDYLLDPVPVPDVVESNSDTAWGLWQDSVQSLDDTAAAPISRMSEFDETLPSDLTLPNTVKRRPPV